MIFMAKVCPKAINFAIAESIHQLLVLRPHPSAQATSNAPDAAVLGGPTNEPTDKAFLGLNYKSTDHVSKKLE